MTEEKIDTEAVLQAYLYGDAQGDELFYDKKFADGFRACGRWFMELPLCDRLTDFEKEKIRQLHNKVMKYAELNTLFDDLMK